jgi:PhnB protein
MTVKPIPEGYTSVTPYLTVDDAKGAIEFYKRAFGATERGVMAVPDGRIAHAELQIGNAVVMLCDKLPEFFGRTPKELSGTTVSIFLFVEDVDAVVQCAADAGATVIMEPDDQIWGDRLGQVEDPFGHLWLIATRVEDVKPAELEARTQAVFASLAR